MLSIRILTSLGSTFKPLSVKYSRANRSPRLAIYDRSQSTNHATEDSNTDTGHSYKLNPNHISELKSEFPKSVNLKLLMISVTSSICSLTHSWNVALLQYSWLAYTTPSTPAEAPRRRTPLPAESYRQTLQQGGRSMQADPIFSKVTLWNVFLSCKEVGDACTTSTVKKDLNLSIFNTTRHE